MKRTKWTFDKWFKAQFGAMPLSQTKLPYRCPVCNGTGKVWPGGDSTSMSKQPCHACNGTGIVWG